MIPMQAAKIKDAGRKNMDTLLIGQYIKNLRKTAGMTQKDLAEKLNVSFQAVSKWENGERVFHPVKLGGYLAQAFMSAMAISFDSEWKP